jgi:hypothetical protein
MNWAAAHRLTDSLVAATFDEETFMVLPMARAAGVNSAVQPDPSRVSFTFLGSIDQFPRDLPVSFAQPPGLSSPAGRGSDAAVSHEWVITADAIAWPYWPGIEDFIEHAGARYAIGARPRNDSGRAVIFANRVRKP